MSAATKGTKRPARNRGPFAHADDYRGALANLDAVLADLAENATRWDSHEQFRKAVGIAGASASGMLRAANEMIEGGHRLRGAARRLLVARDGIKHARRWDGWKLPKRERGEA